MAQNFKIAAWAHHAVSIDHHLWYGKPRQDFLIVSSKLRIKIVPRDWSITSMNMALKNAQSIGIFQKRRWTKLCRYGEERKTRFVPTPLHIHIATHACHSVPVNIFATFWIWAMCSDMQSNYETGDFQNSFKKWYQWQHVMTAKH